MPQMGARDNVWVGPAMADRRLRSWSRLARRSEQPPGPLVGPGKDREWILNQSSSGESGHARSGTSPDPLLGPHVTTGK